MAAAVFYGECSKQGIPPTAAERAAIEMTGQYRRWWVDAVANPDESGAKPKTKRKRAQDEHDEDRNVIWRVAKRQQDQGGGYVYPLPEQENNNTSPEMKSQEPPSDTTCSSSISGLASISIDGEKVPISLPSWTAKSESSPADGTHKIKDKDECTKAKAQLLAIIQDNSGNAASDEAKAVLQSLHSYYLTMESDARSRRSALSGNWLALSQPAYNGCLGTNAQHHSKYTLGRMSFDMYRPTTLVCSIQANFSSIQIIDDPSGIPEHVPRRLRAEVQKCHTAIGSTLRSYSITVAITVEADQPLDASAQSTNEKDDKGNSDDGNKPPVIAARPIRGIMKNHGYMLPDPKIPNRLSIWFTAGTLEVNDNADLDDWKRIFSAQPKLGLYDRANILAAHLLLGANMPETMDEDGTMSYELRRPIGGHGLAYCDVLYLDDDLRVLRGHGGQVYVCARLAETEG